MGFFSKPPQAQSVPPPGPNPLISAYTHLSSLDRADEALTLLHQLASMVKPIMRKRSWKVGTLAEFLPDNPALQGLNTNYGTIINIRLRPSRTPNSFYGMDVLMDTMLHELTHNVHTEHDQHFYALLDEIKRDWGMLSAKGYQGEGFFSQGQRLGSGHTFYKPSIAVSVADRRLIKDAAERRSKGIVVRPEGRRLGGDQPVPVPTIPSQEGQRFSGGVGGDNFEMAPSQEGRRLGGGVEGDNLEMDPRKLAAMAAERRARDQQRCGAKHAGDQMRKETEKAQREGTTTQAKDIGKVIDLNDLKDYDLEGISEFPRTESHPNGLYEQTATMPRNTPFLSDWICELCTFQNPPLYLSCKICQTQRKLNDDAHNYVDLTEGAGTSWDCQLCTFRNENVTDGKCMVCGMEIVL